MARHALVGRTAELYRLSTAFDAVVAAGGGATVLLTGEAGIGKTRLVTELADRARQAGATVLIGRCVDLVDAGLPYLPLVEALRPVPDSPFPMPEPPVGRLDEGSRRLRLFEQVRAVLAGAAETVPVLLIIEDLHWADTSTIDLVSFLGQGLREHPVFTVATYRSDEPGSQAGLRRLMSELVRARAATLVELAPLPQADLHVLLSAAGEPMPSGLAEAIVSRCGGNPFFAEELLAAALQGDYSLPAALRDVLLQRVGRLDADGQAVLRVAAAARREVPYRLLAAMLPRATLRSALREAVEHGVLLADQPAGTFRFRHALLAEAVYLTLLPGERDELHARLATTLERFPDLAAAGQLAGELARHWTAAGRPVQAFPASIQASFDAEAAAGLAEALRHLEHAIETWPAVADAAELAGAPLPAVLARAAELADLTGDGPRAVTLIRRAIELVDRAEASVLYERLGSYLLPTGDREAGLAACRQAVELMPEQPPTAARAWVLTTLGNALMLSWRHEESRAVCQEAVDVAQAAGQPAARTLGVLGIDLCYLGRPDEGMARIKQARRLVRDMGTPREVALVCANLCESLVATGRLAEAAEVAIEGRAVACRLGAERSFGVLLAAYAAEGLLETGDWIRAEAVLAEALDAGATFWGHFPYLVRAQLDIGRGDFVAARRHLDAGGQGAREPTSVARYARLAAELALWEGRPAAAAEAVDAGLRGSGAATAAFQRVRLCALGLRAEADRARFANVGANTAVLAEVRERAGRLLDEARRSAAPAAPVTPDAAAWLAVAEAEHARAAGGPDPTRWTAAAANWDALGRPYHTAYCHLRCAEAYVSAAAFQAVPPQGTVMPPAIAAGPEECAPAQAVVRRATGWDVNARTAARLAHRIVAGLGAQPLRRELELLAQRARLDLIGLDPQADPASGRMLGLTRREGEVLQLLARGYTNRQIAAECTTSVKTASVHVSNILRKLGVSSRFEAAAIAQHLPADQPAQISGPVSGYGNGGVTRG